MAAVVLRAGDWLAEVRPELGGAITALEKSGRPILRPTPDGTDQVLQTACFPLVPYANRIADGRFTYEGREVSLPVLDQFAPHALHGDGWLQPWTVREAGTSSVTLELDWPGATPGWPWPWRACQEITLTDQGLEVQLSLTNTGVETMPAGLGLHPYFVKPPDGRLHMDAQGVWLTDGREIPYRLAPPDTVFDWTGGPALSSAPFVDHAYWGWNQQARIEGEAGRVTLTASANAGWAQVYAPVDENFLCVEPVTHRPDAFNAPADEQTGLVRLTAGQTFAMWMRIGCI